MSDLRFYRSTKDFRERFNFYYYWDTGSYADAFEGCAGTLPNEFWNDAPFTDVAIIMFTRPMRVSILSRVNQLDVQTAWGPDQDPG